MSLPELELVLSTHRRERAEERHAEARAAFLASAAKWNQALADEYNELLEELADIIAPLKVTRKPERATRRNLAALFGAVGLPPSN